MNYEERGDVCMAVTPLVVSYPNFTLGQIISPDEANQNNSDIQTKANDLVVDVNANTLKVASLDLLKSDKLTTYTKSEMDAKNITQDDAISLVSSLSLQRKTIINTTHDINLITDIGIYTCTTPLRPLNWPSNYGGLMCIFKQADASTASGLTQVIFSTNGEVWSRYLTTTGYTVFLQMATTDKVLESKTVLTSADNLNDVLTMGVYHVSSTSLPINWPSTSITGGTLVVLRQTASPSLIGIVQIIYGTNDKILSRYRNTTGFTSFTDPSYIGRKTVLTSIDDINNILENGIYQINSSSKPINWPSLVVGGVFTVMRQTVLGEVTGIVQTVHLTSGDILSRYKTSFGFSVFKLSNDYGHPIDYDYSKIRNSLSKIFTPFETKYAMPYVSSAGILSTYPINTKITGIPYSSVFYAGNDVLYNKTLSTYYSAILNPASILYTEFGGNGSNNRAGIYGVVCSTLVGYLSGLDIYYITSEIKNILDFYVYTDSCDLRVGDAMLSVGHIKMVSDIHFNPDGTIYRIEIAEAWMPLSRKRFYTVSSFEKQLEQYGGAFRLGRFPTFKARTMEKIEYATDCIPNYGDKSVYKNGESVKLYVADPAVTSIYFKKSTDVEFINVVLSTLVNSIVNGVVVYDITSLLSSVGTWNITTNTANVVKATIFICNTGTVTVVDDSFSVEGYSDNITPLWYQVMLLSTGTPLDYWYPAPDGYVAGTVQNSKKMIENVSGEVFTIPVEAGYYIRVHYKTPYGQIFKDSNYTIIGEGGDPPIDDDGTGIGGIDDGDPIVGD